MIRETKRRRPSLPFPPNHRHPSNHSEADKQSTRPPHTLNLSFVTIVLLTVANQPLHARPKCGSSHSLDDSSIPVSHHPFLLTICFLHFLITFFYLFIFTTSFIFIFCCIMVCFPCKIIF